MSGAIPPLPQYAFMARCSVKAQGQLYLYLYLLSQLIMERAYSSQRKHYILELGVLNPLPHVCGRFMDFVSLRLKISFL
jgi:hypothetical protein